MRARREVRAAWLWWAAVVVLSAGSLASASAQSGRAVPPPKPEATPPGKEEPELAYVSDPDPGRYKLIDAAGDGEGRQARFNNFIGRLNEAGARGYRLLSIVNGWNPVAVVKLDQVRYEYGWFETSSDGFWFANDNSPGVFARQARGGFRLAERFFISRNCWPVNADDSLSGDVCSVTDLYLLEREKGVERPRQFYHAGSMPSWRSKMGEELTAQVKEHLGKGLYPTHAFSRFELLLEEAEVSGSPEVRVVTLGTWGKGNLEKKVNALARRGFRLAVTGHKVAVMHRPGGDATPFNYVWLKAKDKNFEKEFARLREAGAVYSMTYPDGDGRENQLVFEQGPAAGARRRDYRVLKLDYEDVLDAVEEKKVRADRVAPLSKEAAKMFDQLVREGYEVRDLFFSDRVCVLLERPSTSIQN
jgi:hypothetical protein